jgi:hypothetical protein
LLVLDESDFDVSDGVEDDGLEDDEEPLPAEPPVVAPELELELGLVDDAPPLDWSFFSIELDEDELEGAVLDGLDGVLLEPAEDELDGVDGVVDDGLVLLEDPLLLPPPPRSQAVSIVAPSAMEIAIAMVDSLMWPPWLG